MTDSPNTIEIEGWVVQSASSTAKKKVWILETNMPATKERAEGYKSQCIYRDFSVARDFRVVPATLTIEVPE